MSFAPLSFNSWVDFLRTTLQGCQENLADIFDAASVRELWLQGELYLAGKRAGMPFLYANNRPDGYAGAVDLSYWDSHNDDAQLLMLAEVKLLGTAGYFQKNFDGYRSVVQDHEEISRTGRLVIHPERLKIREPRGGLLWDYMRLVNYQTKALKMLVLVLDVRTERRNTLGDLLMAVEFERPGTLVFRNQKLGILCKAWEVKGASETTDVPVLPRTRIATPYNVNKPCIFSVIGPHGGESLEQIFARKIEDTFRCKHTLWLARSESCSPQLVQQLCTDGPVACYFLEPVSSGGARPAVTAESAKEYSPDGSTWTSLHKDLSLVTGKVRDGKAWALVLDSIVLQEGDTTVDVSQFNDLRTGEPVHFKLGASTVCAVPGSCKHLPKMRRVAAIAQLTEPFCVWVR